MRVLTVGNMYPPPHLGGYELVWHSANEHLRSRGHDVRVLTTAAGAGGTAPPDGEGGVERVLRWYWRDHAWPRLRPGERLAIERHNARVLADRLARLRPDVVGWWSMGGMSLSLLEQVRRRGIPAAGFVCDGWLVYGPSVDGWMRLAGRRGIARLAERLTGIPARIDPARCGLWLFPSETLRRASAEPWGIPPDATAVAHQGVDPATFPPAARPPWRWRLLYVGRVDPRKGIDLAVRALADLPPEATLEVVGGGDESHLAELGRIAAAAGVGERVRFAGAVPRELLHERYAAADALVFPVRWREPWGLVPLEAMSVGLPVVGSGRGGSGEYMRDGRNCVVFDPEQGGSALAAALRRLADDAMLRERVVAGGRETARAIEPDRFDRAVEETLRRALGERAAVPA